MATFRENKGVFYDLYINNESISRLYCRCGTV